MAVYMMANRYRGTLYVGVTSHLVRRAYEHRESLLPGFTRRYGLKRLVWFERHQDIAFAIHREKVLKHYTRDRKIGLIEQSNRWWEDLYPGFGA